MKAVQAKRPRTAPAMESAGKLGDDADSAKMQVYCCGVVRQGGSMPRYKLRRGLARVNASTSVAVTSMLSAAP